MTKEEQYIKRKIRQLKVKCYKCILKVPPVDAESTKARVKLTFYCPIHGYFIKVKTLKSLLK